MSDLNNLRKRSQRHLIHGDDVVHDTSTDDQSKIPSSEVTSGLDQSKATGDHLHDERYVQITAKATDDEITNPIENNYTTSSWVHRFIADFLTRSKTVTAEWIFRGLRIATTGAVPAELILQGKPISDVSGIMGQVRVIDAESGIEKLLEFNKDGTLQYGGKLIGLNGDFMPMGSTAENAKLLNGKNFDVNAAPDKIVIRDNAGNVIAKTLKVTQGESGEVSMGDTVAVFATDGTMYHVTRDAFKTWIAQATDSEMGYVKLYQALGTNTDGAVTQQLVKTLFEGLVNTYLGIDANAKSATKLQTPRAINGTNFDGSANITTTKWGVARQLTIGDATKSWDGGANLGFTLSELGACADDDVRLANAREWVADMVTRSEAEAGTSTVAKKWSAQRVAEAIKATVPTMTLDKYVPMTGDVVRTGKLTIDGEAINPHVPFDDSNPINTKAVGISVGEAGDPTAVRPFGTANVVTVNGESGQGFEIAVGTNGGVVNGLWFRRFNEVDFGDDSGASEWLMAYTPDSPPDSGAVGLGQVNNWGATSSLTDASATKYATAKAINDLKKLIDTTQNDQGNYLSKTEAASTYLPKTGQAEDSKLFAGKDTSHFVTHNVEKITGLGTSFKAVAKIDMVDTAGKFYVNCIGKSNGERLNTSFTVACSPSAGVGLLEGHNEGNVDINVRVRVDGTTAAYLEIGHSGSESLAVTMDVIPLNGETVTTFDGDDVPGGVTTSIDTTLNTGQFTVTGDLQADGGVFDGDHRVFSPNNRNISSATTSNDSTVYASSKAVKTVYDVANSKWTHRPATLTQDGAVQLSSSVSSTSEALAATPKAVKLAYDKAVEALNKANSKWTYVQATTSVFGATKLSNAIDSTSESLAATPKAVKLVRDLANGKWTYQQATLTDYGATKLSNDSNSSAQDVAATPKAVKDVRTVAESKWSFVTATLSRIGAVQLSSALNSNSETLAATPKAIKAAYDLAASKITKAQGDGWWLGKNAKAVNAHNADNAHTVGGLAPSAFQRIDTQKGAIVGARYITAGSSSTGTKIRLPFKTNATRMVVFTVRVYQGYHTADIQFSGYLYSAPDQWYAPKAVMIAGTADIAVKMGKDTDGQAYVWIGGGAYRGVAILDVVGGHTSANWNTGWSIAQSDDTPNTALNKTVSPPFSPQNRNISADVLSNSTTIYASLKGVKTAYDKGVEALNKANSKWTYVQASLSAYGATKLSSAVNSTSEALAATPKAVKTAYDLAASKITKAQGDGWWLGKTAKAVSAADADKLNNKTSAQIITEARAGTASNADTLDNLNSTAFTRTFPFTTGSSSGQRRYVRLLTIGKTDNNCCFLLHGHGDFGRREKTMLQVQVGTRSDAIKVDAFALNQELSYDAPQLYTRLNGSVFEVWLLDSDYNLNHSLVLTSNHGATIRVDSITTTAPSGLTEVTNKNIYHTGFNPNKAAVGLSAVVNAGQTSSVSDSSTSTYATAKGVKTAYDKGVEALNKANTKWSYVQASLSVYGATKLSSAVNSTSEALAATPKAVKTAYDRGTQALNAANAKWTYAQATKTVFGATKLNSDSNSNDETTAATPKAVKAVRDLLASYYTKSEADARFLGKTAKASSATLSDRVKIHDTRASNYTPDDRAEYASEFVFTNVGTPTATWYSKMSLKGWTDGYASWELASQSNSSTSDGKLWFRSGRLAAWESWDMVYTTRHKPTAADVGALTQATADGRYLLKGATAVNASKLANYSLHGDAIANSVVKRDSARDIKARLFRSDYANQNTISGAMAFRVNNSTDTYIRFCSDKEAIKTWLGITQASLTDYSNNIANGTLNRKAPLTFMRVNAAKTYTVNSSTFSQGDVIEVVVDPGSSCTLNLNSGSIYYPNGVNDGQLIIDAGHTASIIKQDATNWRLLNVYGAV